MHRHETTRRRRRRRSASNSPELRSSTRADENASSSSSLQTNAGTPSFQRQRKRYKPDIPSASLTSSSSSFSSQLMLSRREQPRRRSCCSSGSEGKDVHDIEIEAVDEEEEEEEDQETEEEKKEEQQQQQQQGVVPAIALPATTMLRRPIGITGRRVPLPFSELERQLVRDGIRKQWSNWQNVIETERRGFHINWDELFNEHLEVWGSLRKTGDLRACYRTLHKQGEEILPVPARVIQGPQSTTSVGAMTHNSKGKKKKKKRRHYYDD